MVKTKTHFVWLIRSSKPRRGPDLKKGKVHKTKDYPVHVVEEWVRTKAARYVKPPEKEGEKKASDAGIKAPIETEAEKSEQPAKEKD